MRYFHHRYLRSVDVVLMLTVSSMSVVPGRGSVPYQHVERSHEHDLLCGHGNKIVSIAYVLLLPVEIISDKLNRHNK